MRRAHKVATIATCILLTGTFLLAGAGVAGFLVAKDARLSVLVEAEMKAIASAQRLTEGGLAAARTEPGFASGLHVVFWGSRDDYGISRGSQIVFRDVRDHRLEQDPTLEDRLLERSKALEGWMLGPRAVTLDAVPERDRLGLLEGPDFLGARASAPIMGADGVHVGMVQVSLVRDHPESPVGPTRGGLGLLLAALLIWLARGTEGRRLRAWFAGSSAFACVVVLSLADGGLALWVGGAAGLVAYGAGTGLRRLLLGVWEQPRTYLYIAPAVLALVILVFIPFGMGVTLSLFDDVAGFQGLDNFVEILSPDVETDPGFYWTLGITILWTVLNVVLHVSIGLALALALNRTDLGGRGVYRVLLIVPWAVPSYITALIWKWMFNTNYGAVNALLAVLGVDQINWLGDSVWTNFFANLVTNTWLGFPFMMVVALGALQSIPKDLYEAATIDGASRVQAFRHVTLPLLKPAMVPAIILGTIWTFNMFNVIYLVSGGGPDGKTDILITQAYHAFKVLERDGYAAAYALLIFVILLVYGWMTDRITRASEGAYA